MVLETLPDPLGALAVVCDNTGWVASFSGVSTETDLFSTFLEVATEATDALDTDFSDSGGLGFGGCFNITAGCGLAKFCTSDASVGGTLPAE